MSDKFAVGLPDVVATVRGAGVVWTLEAGEDLNANLVRFPG